MRASLVNIVERSVWTFVEAALAVVITSAAFELQALKVAAVAGGLAVAKVVMVEAAKRRKRLEA